MRELDRRARRPVAQFDDVYDAFKHPRRDRADPADPRPRRRARVRRRVRDRTLDVLDAIDLDPGDPLLADGFVYGMVVQHEHQHDETMLATLQLMDDFAHPEPTVARRPRPRRRTAPTSPARCSIAGGTFAIGTDAEPWAYDNERPAHEVTLAPFRIDTTPVTNRAYARVRRRRRLRRRARLERRRAGRGARKPTRGPQFWRRDGDGAGASRASAAPRTVPPDEPVQHVCWYEADAFARWAGGGCRPRPSGRSPRRGSSPDARQPLARRAAPVRARRRSAPRPGAVSTVGRARDARRRVGVDRVRLPPLPGLRPSLPGVLRGVLRARVQGAARRFLGHPPAAVRTTFRNWDHPIRRQIFAGFRCARDA